MERIRWWEQALVLGLITLDQATKALARTQGAGGVIDPVTNERLMFGIDIGLSNNAVLVLSLAVAVGWWLVADRSERPVAAVARSLLVAGIVGNAIDRVALDGAVQDWLALGPTRWNVADVCLLIAFPLLVLAAASGRPSEVDESKREEPVTAPIVDPRSTERRRT